jgi:hypothetical protein
MRPCTGSRTRWSRSSDRPALPPLTSHPPGFQLAIRNAIFLRQTSEESSPGRRTCRPCPSIGAEGGRFLTLPSPTFGPEYFATGSLNSRLYAKEKWSCPSVRRGASRAPGTPMLIPLMSWYPTMKPSLKLLWGTASLFIVPLHEVPSKSAIVAARSAGGPRKKFSDYQPAHRGCKVVYNHRVNW